MVVAIMKTTKQTVFRGILLLTLNTFIIKKYRSNKGNPTNTIEYISNIIIYFSLHSGISFYEYNDTN